MALFRFNLNNYEKSVTKANIDKTRYKLGNLLIFACFFLYTSSMAAKGVFVAELKYIVDLWSLEYSKASMANTIYFVGYGAVQIILLFIINKIDLNKYLAITVPFAAITTALIGISTNIYHIWVYFGLSGVFQTAIYCGCNYALTQNLPTKMLTKANKIMNIGYAVGFVFAYGMCAFCIGFNAWRVPYFVIGAIFMASLICFSIIIKKAKRFSHINEIMDKHEISKSVVSKKAADNENDPLFVIESKKNTILFYIIDLTLVFLISSLFYGVMSYITSLLVDVHNLSQDVSIYVSILAPVTIAIGPMMVIATCDTHKDFIKQGIIFSIVLIPIIVLLSLFYNLNVFLALILSILFVIIANGVKAIVLSVMTFRMRKQINTASYSAISNAIASISAGVTPTVIGAVIDTHGWSVAYWTLFGVVVLVVASLVIIDVLIRKGYRKRYNLKNNEKI